MQLEFNLDSKSVLYHGTIDFYVEHIVNKGISIVNREIVDSDFGNGFYMTVDNFNQAKEWAEYTARHPRPIKQLLCEMNKSVDDFLEQRMRMKPIVIAFRINDILCFERLNKQIYTVDSLRWKEFVVENRSGGTIHLYDWVYGPVADGGIQSLYPSEIKAYNGYNQLSVHTKEAINCIEILEVIEC
jgi:hypothetical protein